MQTVYFVECYSGRYSLFNKLKFYNFEKPSVVLPYFKQLHLQTFSVPLSSENFHEFFALFPSIFSSALKVAALCELQSSYLY